MVVLTSYVIYELHYFRTQLDKYEAIINKFLNGLGPLDRVASAITTIENIVPVVGEVTNALGSPQRIATLVGNLEDTIVTVSSIVAALGPVSELKALFDKIKGFVNELPPS
jgi:hypothetical protein